MTGFAILTTYSDVVPYLDDIRTVAILSQRLSWVDIGTGGLEIQTTDGLETQDLLLHSRPYS